MGYAKKPQKKHPRKWDHVGGWSALSYRFLQSRTLASLSPYAAKLFVDLLAAYNGFNNGDLCCTWSLMQPLGWKSKATLDKARRELLDKGVITLTRQGGRKWPCLYAITLYWIDECTGKQLEVAPTGFPPNDWLVREPMPSIAEAQAAFKARHQQQAAT